MAAVLALGAGCTPPTATKQAEVKPQPETTQVKTEKPAAVKETKTPVTQSDLDKFKKELQGARFDDVSALSN
jgi:cell division septation protein DedD